VSHDSIVDKNTQQFAVDASGFILRPDGLRSQEQIAWQKFPRLVTALSAQASVA
jgi:hypothetical protein